MCGIAGIINKSKSNFDYSTFCMLGVSNDARGGDSCGIFIDGKYEYGTGKEKFFSSFFLKSKLLKETTKSKIALLHCRKASVGAINESTAQPVIIKNNNKVDFVVIHNGTIYNYKELAKKYISEIDIEGMTDSQVMARIFYYKGYDVLSEYKGSAAFVIVDYRLGNPKTLLFRGSSKMTAYSREAEQERPLFYCIDHSKKQLIFSSIYEYLYTIEKDIDVYYVPDNKLVSFNGSNLVLYKEIDRSKCVQTDNTKVKTKYKYWEDDFYDDYYSGFLTANLTNNKYWVKNAVAHGEYIIGKYGRIEKSLSKGCLVYFFDGCALKNKECYDFLETLRNKLKLSVYEFSKQFQNLIRFLSLDEMFFENNICYKAISPTASERFTGELNQLGTCTVTCYKEGIRTSTYYLKDYKGYDSKIPKNISINFKTLLEDVGIR